MLRIILLILASTLVIIVNSEQQSRQFPQGAIVDPQFYDRPNFDEGPLDRPPQFGGRPPYGGDAERPYYGDESFGGGRPPHKKQQGYKPRPYRPTPPPGFGPYPPPQSPYPAGYNEQSGFGGYNPMGSFSNALESIAKYDEKQCVARMLCELSAGGRPGSGYYRGSGSLFDFSGLQGIADLLGAMTASSATSSPMLTFGRAALLGATMRDPYRCYRSFPNCPRDPDRLVDYLNNHNGGFFRLFEPTPTAPSTPTKNPYYRKGAS